MSKYKNTDNKEYAIMLSLLQGNSIVATANKCSCSVNAVYTRLNDEKFKNRLKEEQKQLFERSKHKIQYILTDAIEVAECIMNDAEVPPNTRLTACNLIISNVLKITEICDISERLTELEKRLTADENT